MNQLAVTLPGNPAIGEVDWTDIFCGAGGSSLGVESVPGMHVTQALNHWDLAVEAHNANFPDADHDVHDVQEIPATRFKRTRCLWASPECTHHAYCRGPKADSDEAVRSRSTFQDIVRFTKHHRYDAIVVENVIEARLWCDARSHGEKCSCGSSFNSWYADIIALGYEGKILYFNSQFAYPTPQSRDRMYVVFWRKGLKAPNLDFQPLSWCSHCQEVVHSIQTWKTPTKKSLRTKDGLYEWGRYGSQYLYHCPQCAQPAAPAVMGARTIIDWALPAPRIGDRDKPLADKTRQRIKTGLERLSEMQPVTVQVGGHLYERPGYARVWSIHTPLKSVTGTQYMGLVVPNMEHNLPRAVDEPVGTITTGNRHMLVQVNRGAKKGVKDSRPVGSIDEPTRTIAGHGELAIVSMRNHGLVTDKNEPTPTVCSGGNHHGVLVYNGVPGFVRDLGDACGTLTSRDKQSLLVPYYSTGVAHTTSEPMGTVTTVDRQALVVTDDDVDDCGFRMLQWHELLKAQQMHEHSDGRAYELTAKRRDKRGNMRELSNEQRVKMIGNAVSSPVAAMLANAISEILVDAA